MLLKVLLIQFFPVALSVILLLVYARCNFASVLKFDPFFVRDGLLGLCFSNCGI